MRKFYTAFYVFLLFISIRLPAQSVADFTNYNTANTPVFSSNTFRAIAVGKDGYIWAGTQYQGLYRFNPKTETWVKSDELTNVFINDIKSDADGGIWIGQSGIQGSQGGGSNIAGGINYFPSSGSFLSMSFYSVTPGGGLTTRNVRSLWIDTMRSGVRPKVWAAQATFITSGNTSRGGIGVGLNATTDYFSKVTGGLEVSAHPSCLSVGGNNNEILVMVLQNYGKSQFLSYSPEGQGAFRKAYDYTNVPALAPGFRTNVIYSDLEGRMWIGMQNGGILVKVNDSWLKPDLPAIAGAVVNNNAITGDDDGNVYIGTSAGLLVFKGGDPMDSLSYELYTSEEGLPSNDVTGITVDTLHKRVVLATTGGVSFWKPERKVKVELAWDHSFPAQEMKPRGVAADGVSRLYLKIKKESSEGAPIKEVRVSLHEYTLTERTTRGKLKIATELDAYSEEASSGTETEVNRTDSAADGFFYFWYVSPEDFSNEMNGPYSKMSERKDVLKILLVYDDDTKDSTLYDMKVVRPPLLLVHGLASGPSTWDNLYTDEGHLQPVLGKNPIFRHSRALTMDGRGAFIENAARLLSGDLGDADGKLNSLQGNIEDIRRKGYAANQVDYLCHSMGGIMIRGAAGWFPGKFRANGDYLYNNYGAGFVHKLIFVNTPHNSSPIADAVEEFVPQLPDYLNRLLTYAYKHDPTMQMPFDFFQPKDQSNEDAYTFKASDAVRDLQISDQAGGKNLPFTGNIKNHLIIGDVDMTTAALDGLVDSLFLEYPYLKTLINVLLQVARDRNEDKREELTMMFDENYSPRQRMLLWWNLYSASKGFPGFMADGDLIVPLASETARQPGNSPNITKFLNSPGSSYNASHVTILARWDVGKRILDLLNDRVNDNPLFGDIVPANNDAEPTRRIARRTAVTSMTVTNETAGVSTHYGTDKIEIDASLKTISEVFSGNILTVKFKVKDTEGLAYIDVYFQGEDSFRLNKSAVQEIALQVSPVYTGRQPLFVRAVYDVNGGVEHHIDTLFVTVTNRAAPSGFRITAEEVQASGKLPYTPQYEVMYDGKWVKLLPGDPDITITLSTEDNVVYDPADYSFKPLNDGFTQAIFSYKGFKDTVQIRSFNAPHVTPSNKILFNSITRVYGDEDTDPGATTTSGLEVTYEIADPRIATITGGKLHIVKAGVTTITAKQSGNGQWPPAADVSVTLMVKKAPLTITADDKDKNEGEPNPGLTVSYRGFMYNETEAVLVTPPAVTTTATQSSTPGDYPVTATGAVAENYTITYVPGTLTVKPAVQQPQTITFAGITKTYGAAAFDPEAKATSGLPVSYSSDNPAVAIITDGFIHITGAGTANITASQAGNQLYPPAPNVTKTLLVNKAVLNIRAEDKTKTYNEPIPSLTVVYTGFVNGETYLSLTNPPTVTTTATNGSAPGVYPITVSGAAAHNYEITYTQGSLRINPDQSAQFAFTVFTVAQKDADVLLTWMVKNQDDNTSHFEVERSVNETDFTLVSTILPINSSSQTILYGTTDANVISLESPYIYYRIKQIGKDGQTVYSDMRGIEINNRPFATMLYPNPAYETVTLQFRLRTTQKVTVVLTDLTGKIMRQVEFTGQGGLNQKSLNIADLANGVYTIVISSKDNHPNLRLLKTR